MEARRFGFIDEPPAAYRFDPTDEEIVAHYLLPRAVGVRSRPYEHAVIDDDPCSCPPWELLRRHGHGESDQQAFFFGTPRDMEPNADGHVISLVVGPAAPGGAGGVWLGRQTGVDTELVIVRGGAQRMVRFRRCALTYYRDGDRSSSGWVMHEYHVVHPVLHPGAVIARIKITKRAKKMRKRMQKLRQEAAAVAAAARALPAAVAPGPDQPGPSNYFVSESHSDDGHHAAVVASAAVGEGTSSGGGAHQSVKEEDGGINYIISYKAI